MNDSRSGLKIALLIGAALLVSTALEGAPPAADVERDASDYATVAERLTPQHINRVRFMELRPCREVDRGPSGITPDRVTVRIPQDTVETFLSSKIGERGFKGDVARRRFLTLTPPQKLATIAYWVHDTEEEWNYADQLDISRDPEIIVEFRRRVQPLLLNGCASSACHGGGDIADVKMRLYNDPRRGERNTYANFITLREWNVGGQRLLNQDRPADSVLLKYMIQHNLSRTPHPEVRGFRPMYLNERTPALRTIEQWIGALRKLHPERGYGFRLLPEMALPTATAPSDDADSSR